MYLFILVNVYFLSEVCLLLSEVCLFLLAVCLLFYLPQTTGCPFSQPPTAAHLGSASVKESHLCVGLDKSIANNSTISNRGSIRSGTS